MHLAWNFSVFMAISILEISLKTIHNGQIKIGTRVFVEDDFVPILSERGDAQLIINISYLFDLQYNKRFLDSG